MNLENVVRIFHEPDCPGLITGTEEKGFQCAECGEPVSKEFAAEQLIQLRERSLGRE
jgi:hypothetical protein